MDDDYTLVPNDKHKHTRTLSSRSNSSLRSFILRYFQRNSLKSVDESPYNAQHLTKMTHPIRRKTIANHGTIPNTLSPVTNHRLNRQTTTATFTGQKRCLNGSLEDHRIKSDLLINQDEEQLVRARLDTRTSSLPAARCISYYYYQNPISLQAKIFEDQNHSRLNSLTNERNRSQSHSSSQGVGNGTSPTTDASDHSSSFENVLDEEHRRLNRRHQPSGLLTPYHSSRYSQRAVAQFMHERNKARLRRNQKASRMLGMIKCTESTI
jgi:hypothetical protein